MKVTFTYYVLHHPYIPSLDVVATSLDEFRKLVHEEHIHATEDGRDEDGRFFWDQYPAALEITCTDYDIRNFLTWRSDPDDSKMGCRPDCEEMDEVGVTRREMDWEKELLVAAPKAAS